MVPVLPMFPLGTVLFPHVLMPLHVFEPRYRQMLEDLLAGEDAAPGFGIVLITRGHEVGGGDERTNTGTMAKVLDARELDDGRWVLLVAGTHRIAVKRWLPDAPYPRAEVVPLADTGPDDTSTARLMGSLVPRVRRILALQSELGDTAAPATIELADDPAGVFWQVAGVAPLTPLDGQALLEAVGWAARIDLLDRLLTDAEELLTLRLSPGGR